ncbi:MAG: methionine biosynthesis protein MetW [Patescibacteria group bacterium]|jgi:methionine biosynthesis protein MetW
MFNFPWIRKPNYPKLARLDYDEYWKTRGFAIKNKLREREECILANIPSGSKVLDIGCGNSKLPIALKEKGCIVSVGDISPVVLEGFKSHGIKPIIVDLTNIGAAQDLHDSFDYIILSEVLEHLPNPEEVILALSPLTRHFAITIPNSAYFWFRFGLMFNGRCFTQWVHHPSEHLRFWSHVDFLDWLKAMDLRLIKSNASNGRRWLKDIWPNMFGFQIVYLVETE